MTKKVILKLTTGLAIGCVLTAHAVAAEVNIYSYRQPQLIEPILKAFTEETNIKTNVLFLKRGLIERLKTEGIHSPADLILTVDISRLDRAKESGVTQVVSNNILNSNIPVQYRDNEGHWFGLTRRARVVYASKERVKQDEISYEELADPKWRGKICVRDGQHSYNLGLFSSMINHHGRDAAAEWIEGVKNNLARRPTGNDRAQVEAIFSGECDISLGNTYYLGLMQTNDKDPEQKKWAASVKLLFPNSSDRGTHVNISGVALTKHAPNKENALKLMEYLSSDKAQELYAEANFEYPVNSRVTVSQRVSSWGELKADDLSLNKVASEFKSASELVDIVGYNNGPDS